MAGIRAVTSCRLARVLWFALWLPLIATAQQWGLNVTDPAAGGGAEVSAVAPDSPAARAGLRVGDRVLAVQGKPTRSAADVATQVQSLAPGSPLQLLISRDGWERTLSLESQLARGPAWLGATVADTAVGAGQPRRIAVTATAANSPAARAGLQPGDLVLAANGRNLKAADELEKMLAGSKAGDTLTITASRDGWQKRIAVMLERRPDALPAAPQPQAPRKTPSPPDTDRTANAELAAAASQHYQRQDWPQAERLYREYVGRSPQESWAWERLGHVLLMQERYADAVEAGTKAIELGPPSSTAWNNVGLSLLRLGNLAGARSAYLRAVEISPDLTVTRFGLGSVYVAERSWEKAREQLEYVVDHEPGNAAALEALAGAYGALGRPADAASTYRRAIDAGAAGRPVNYALAWSLYQADRPREALAPLQNLLRAQPDDAEVLTLYGHVQSRLGDATAARTAWERAARLDPGNPSVEQARRQLATSPAMALSAPAAGASVALETAASTATVRTAEPPAPEAQASPERALGGPSGAKAAVAVGDFQVKAAGASSVIGDGLREMMVTTLHSSGRFVVVERIDVSGLAAEQALSRSRMARPGAAIPDRQMDVADIMVYGAVTEFLAEAKGSSFDIGVAKLPLSLGRQSNKAHMAIDVRVADVVSGRILGSQRIIGEADSSQLAMGARPTVHGNAIPLSLGMYNNTPMEQAIRTCIEKAVAYVDQSVPPQYYRHR